MASKDMHSSSVHKKLKPEMSTAITNTLTQPWKTQSMGYSHMVIQLFEIFVIAFTANG